MTHTRNLLCSNKDGRLSTPKDSSTIRATDKCRKKPTCRSNGILTMNESPMRSIGTNQYDEYDENRTIPQKEVLTNSETEPQHKRTKKLCNSIAKSVTGKEPRIGR